MDTVKKLSLRDRRRAQPKAVVFFSDEEKKAIQETVAKNLDHAQASIFFYQCQALGLNPLLNEICAVTYKDREGGNKMSIQVMRDGFLTIAHKSGKFAGMESGVNMDGVVILCGWAKVWHKDFQVPLYQEADFSEYYSDRNSLWKSKPKTMIKKVAESMALRKAFNVSGVYAPEELDSEINGGKLPTPLAIENGDKPASAESIETIKNMGGVLPEDGQITRQEAANMIKILASTKGKKV